MSRKNIRFIGGGRKTRIFLSGWMQADSGNGQIPLLHRAESQRQSQFDLIHGTTLH